MPKRVDFYFDYLSPYAFFAWLRIRAFCGEHSAELAIHPVLFAGLLEHWGQLGPAEIAPKRAWVYRDAFRYAALHGIPIVGPQYHPFNPLPALRASLAVTAGADQATIIDALFRAGWSEGIDLGSRDALAAALTRAGLDGPALIARADLPDAKNALRAETDAAVALGVFGVPAMVVGGELFWGSDRFDHLALALTGRDPLDHNAVETALGRPRAAARAART